METGTAAYCTDFYSVPPPALLISIVPFSLSFLSILPAGAGTALLGSLLTRPGAFPGATQAPRESCAHNAFQKTWPEGTGSHSSFLLLCLCVN